RGGEMRSTFLHSVAVVVSLFALTVPISAHHSVASEYDVNKLVTVKGVVTRVEWQNPHIFYYVEVPEAAKAGNWAIEFGAPNSLYRAGWRKDSIKPGDTVTIEGNPARYRPNAALLRMLTTSDGRQFGAKDNKLVVDSPETGGPTR